MNSSLRRSKVGIVDISSTLEDEVIPFHKHSLLAVDSGISVRLHPSRDTHMPCSGSLPCPVYFLFELEAVISIPVFSRRCDSFLTPIQFAPFRSSDRKFSSRSDLRHVPTLRTFLRYKHFFIRSFGSPGSGLTCRQKRQISHPDRREISLQFRAIAVKNHGDFSQSP